MAAPSSNTTPLLSLPTPTSSSSQSSSATPATPTTTPTAPTTTTSNAATSTSATSSASTAATSSASISTQSSSSSTAGLTPATTPFVTTSGDQVITSTSFVVTSATPAPANNSTTSSSFFANKGAVAGVFTVVGLIVVALIVTFVVNAIRRRRAENFDRDVAEAAAEAAASSRSPFDDYSYNNSGGNGGGGSGGGAYGYSDNSHGTFQLPPLSPHNEVYGMTEMSQFDPYSAGAASLAASAVGRSRSRKESEPGAPGIAGVGAGTLGREPSKRAPYHAFAGPQPHELQGSNGTFRSRRSNQDVLEAAGLGGAGVAAFPSNNNINNGASGAFVTRKPSETAQSTQFGRSQLGSMSSGGHLPTQLQPGYPVESYYPQRNESHSPDPFAGYPPITTVSKPLPNPHQAAAPLPSLTGHQSDHNEDFTESGSPTALRSDEQRMSYQDDTDYSQGHRVLRVANE